MTLVGHFWDQLKGNFKGNLATQTNQEIYYQTIHRQSSSGPRHLTHFSILAQSIAQYLMINRHKDLFADGLFYHTLYIHII